MDLDMDPRRDPFEDFTYAPKSNDVFFDNFQTAEYFCLIFLRAFC